MDQIRHACPYMDILVWANFDKILHGSPGDYKVVSDYTEFIEWKNKSSNDGRCGLGPIISF